MAAPADQVMIVLLSAFVGYGSKGARDWWSARKARKKEAEALWSLHKRGLLGFLWVGWRAELASLA